MACKSYTGGVPQRRDLGYGFRYWFAPPYLLDESAGEESMARPVKRGELNFGRTTRGCSGGFPYFFKD